MQPDMETELETQEKQASQYCRKSVQDARHDRIRKDADWESQLQTDEDDDVEPFAEVMFLSLGWLRHRRNWMRSWSCRTGKLKPRC